MNSIRAKVIIKYAGTLEELAAKLQGSLGVPQFETTNDEDPPYTVYASCECLGFDLRLEDVGRLFRPSFRLEVQPEIDVSEFGRIVIHDASSWLAKHIAVVAAVQCYPAPESQRKEAEPGATDNPGDAQ